LERVFQQCKILNNRISIESGAEFLTFIKEKKKGAQYLVFLDLVMPPPNGIAVLNSLSGQESAKGCIFIMLSGVTDIKAVNQGYQLGAQTFIIKPVKPEDVMELLSALKSKITINQSSEGNSLDWIHSQVSQMKIPPGKNGS
jgi:response regulator RpfG family c-di-GMP phosphodiesterase